MTEPAPPPRTFKPLTEKRIFVLCPGGLVTGGPELLHQLVNALVAAGRDAYIAYTPLDQAWSTPPEYARYGCPVAQHVPDEPDTAVIVPEVATFLLFGFRRARHAIWWLSVDNYSGAAGTPAGWNIIFRRIFNTDIPSPSATTHLFQSAYARDYVQGRFKVGGAMLSDYLAADYFSEPPRGPRRNVVVYNPKKGYAETARLIRASPDIEFSKLEGMTRHQLRGALDSARVYIDLGVHPGKDRIPREAAMRGAVVVVARRGAARYFEDVPLDDAYKVRCGRLSVPRIRRLIKDIFVNFERHQAAQEPYRRAIAAEPAEFRRQVQAVFGLSSNPGDQ